MPDRGVWRFKGGELPLGRRTLVMGVVNVTPDSFSDGGRYLAAGQGVTRGLQLLDQGADILDIGGESTRPGSDPVGTEEELARVLPVIRGIIKARPDAVISIDTYKAQVAAEALEAGAAIINDITALSGDPDMARAAASYGAGLILMHMRGEPRTMQKNPVYQDVVAEVAAHLKARAEDAQAAGVAREAIMLDPGIGFGKTLEHNLALIRGLGQLAEVGYPVLLGASNKTMLGTITGQPLGQRLWATVGCHVAGAMLGADVVRVHEAAPVRDAVLVADAIMGRGREEGEVAHV